MGETNGDEIFYLGFLKALQWCKQFVEVWHVIFLRLPLLWINFSQKTFDNLQERFVQGQKQGAIDTVARVNV